MCHQAKSRVAGERGVAGDCGEEGELAISPVAVIKIRNPNIEFRNNFKNSNDQNEPFAPGHVVLNVWILNFEFVWSFDIRI
jgi:hypothetical protein